MIPQLTLSSAAGVWPASQPVLFSLLDKVLGKILTPEADADPSKPFTPPPSLPSEEEQKDDDNDGPSFPMSPALA